MADQSTGVNRGMNGLALGLREHNQVNPLNPASYSAIDSLTFLFDAGLSLQATNFSERGVRKNANNADFEYVVAGFRLMPRLGMSFGLLPLTTVGYSYSQTTDATAPGQPALAASTQRDGSGGLHQAYIGLGYRPWRGLSVGANLAYVYGDITRTVTTTLSDAYANTLTKTETADVTSYRLTLGAQYELPLHGGDALTVGLTAALGHDIGGKPRLDIASHNPQTGVADTTTWSGGALKLRLPHELAAGAMWTHGGWLRVGADYQYQRWSTVAYPKYHDGGQGGYVMDGGYHMDRHKMTLGASARPDARGRSIIKRSEYRAGVSYATPYYKVDGHDGPAELSASVGVGIPIANGYNSRSTLNISGQWVHRQASGLIRENVFRINIGLTFNERWFAKWKVE